MPIQWLKHAKWPSVLVRLHYYSIVSFVLLLISGLALYLPSVHTPLIPYLPYIYKLHILLGIIFGITLLTPFAKWLPKGKHIWRLDWWFPIVFGIGIVLTGIVLWQITWFPSTWRNSGFKWHGDLSYILGAWLIVHAFAKTFGLRPDADGWAGRTDPTRRRFLGYLGTGGIAAAVLVVIDPFAAFSRWWHHLGQSADAARSAAANQPATARFAALYTVTGNYPAQPLDTYKLTVDGLVAHPATLDWKQIQHLPKSIHTANFQCVTGWSVPNVKWAGIHLQHLVDLAKPAANAAYVHFYSFDGQYTESLSLKEALDPSVLLAYELDGAPLPQAQGAPIRLVVPSMYGYKSIKWVNRVSFATEPLMGYWEQRGYPNEAVIGSYRSLF